MDSVMPTQSALRELCKEFGKAVRLRRAQNMDACFMRAAEIVYCAELRRVVRVDALDDHMRWPGSDEKKLLQEMAEIQLHCYNQLRQMVKDHERNMNC